MPHRPAAPVASLLAACALLIPGPPAARAAPDDPPSLPAPGEEKKGKKEDGEKDEKKEGDKEEGGTPAVVKRPAPPKDEAAQWTAGGPDLFDANAEGKYQFNFRGAPWPAVVTQLADASGLSLDWQELPGDYLNLRTQRDYTAEEARDLINRHLLARGFTLLRDGEVLTVVNLKKLDPGAVPAVTPEELDTLPGSSFVKCVFALEWLPADRAAEELKVLLSPRGKLTALPGSNRVLAMDAAENLRQLAAIIREEQEGRGRERLVKQFRFEHVRADRAKELLEEFLGIAEEEEALSSNPQQAQMQMQMRMQQAQQQAQQNGGKGGGAPKQEIRLIVNDRENSVLAQAPPEQMAIIERSVEALDVPRAPGDGLLAKMLMREDPVRIYRLARLDPELVVRLLSNSGELSPLTRVEVDKKANALVVNGPPTDHLVIAKLVDTLDGTDRSFEVIPLRRLPADYIAGTVRFMMGLEEEEQEDSSRSSRYSYFSYGYGSSRGGDDEEEAEGAFRIDADVQNNRLLLWANPVELAEVNALLVKLGEIRTAGAGRPATRVLDVTADQAAEILERLETAWPRTRENPLQLPPDPPPAPAEGPPAEEQNVTARPRTAARPARLVQQTAPPATASSGNMSSGNPSSGNGAPAGAPPVSIRRTPDGRLVLESDDLDALDALEELAVDLTPPQRDFHVFQLEHVQSTGWLVLQLEDFFNADKQEKETLDWWGDPINVREDGPGRLSDRKPLRFIGDTDTRTILVQNATASQLRQIADLLKIWDRSPEQRGGSLRLTKMFDLKSAKAEEVAATLKDVYRDLLSDNDPARQNGGGEDEKKSASGPAYTYVYGRNSGGDEDGREPDPPIRFKGLLSVGVHAESNTLVVSASEGLMANVEVLVASLEANAQQAVAASMMWQGGPKASEEVKTRLRDVFGERLTIAPGRAPASARVGAARTLGEPAGGE